MAERPFSTAFARRGSAANTVLRQTLQDVAAALDIPPTSHAAVALRHHDPCSATSGIEALLTELERYLRQDA